MITSSITAHSLTSCYGEYELESSEPFSYWGWSIETVAQSGSSKRAETSTVESSEQKYILGRVTDEKLQNLLVVFSIGAVLFLPLPLRIGLHYEYNKLVAWDLL